MTDILNGLILFDGFVFDEKPDKQNILEKWINKIEQLDIGLGEK